MFSRFLTYSMFRRVRAFLAGFTALSMVLTSTPALAANLYFIGDTSTAFETATNWSTTADPAGSEPGAAPGAGDVAIFTRQSAGRTALITAATALQGLILAPTFTGSLLVHHNLGVGSVGMRVGSGFYVGSTFPLTISGSLTQTGGVLRGLQGNLTVTGSLMVSRGGAGLHTTIFTATGTVIMEGTRADQNLFVGTDVNRSFKNLRVNNRAGTTADDIIINASGGLNLSGTLTITLGNLDLTTFSNAMVVDRGITLADAAQATLTTNSNVTVSGSVLVNNAATITVSAGTWIVNDAGDQDFDIDGQSLYNLTINNAGGGTDDDLVIGAAGELNLSGALTITLGGLDLSTNTETMVVERGITLADAAQATLTTNSNITSSGTVLVNDTATITVSAGTWTLNDTGDQAFDIDGQSIFNLTVNNTGGGTDDDVTVAGGSLQLSGALTVTLGGLDLSTNSLALISDRGITLADAAQATFTTNSAVTVSGSVLVNDAATLTVSAGTWTLNDSGDQAFDVDGQLLYHLTVNNAGGGTDDDVIIAGGALQLSGALTITLGNLDLFSNTLAFITRGGITIAATAQATLESDGNITASGSIATGAAGSFTLSGSTTLTMNGLAQNLDVNNATIYNLTIASGTTLTSDNRILNRLQVNTGASLAFGAFVINATGSSIVNYGQIIQNTGKLVHSGSVILGGSDYAALATISPTATLYIELTETDHNTNGNRIETGSLVITMTGETETVVLTETNKNSGVFRGSIATAIRSAAGNNGTLEGVQDITATATFTDGQDAIVNIDAILFDGSQNTGGTTTTATTTQGTGGGGGGGGARRATPTTVTPAPTTPAANPAKPLTPAEQRKALAAKRKEAAAAKRAAALAKRKAAAAKRAAAAAQRRGR